MTHENIGSKTSLTRHEAGIARSVQLAKVQGKHTNGESETSQVWRAFFRESRRLAGLARVRRNAHDAAMCQEQKEPSKE